MESQTVEKVKDLWETWDIRVCILASLCIQASLTILAPYRKTSASSILRFLIWVLYLSADAIAVFTIGLIASNEADSPQKKEILAFWAPFLLLHLGGPDTITALALEDNELWHRHALQLATQAIITIYVFVISLQHKGLLAPTLLILFDGLWKYFERTCALFFASADNFRDSLVGKPEPGPNYARLMEEYISAKHTHIPTGFENKDGLLTGTSNSVLNNENESTVSNNFDDGLQSEEKLVKTAHKFYELFKAILADGFLSLKDRTESRKFFLYENSAFRVIEIELNLIYDVFYTKSFLLLRRRAFARLLCIIAVIVSIFLFCFRDRSKYHKVDVVTTFVLLGGAITLDICAALMFAMSDWWIIIIPSHSEIKSYFRSIMLVILKSSRWKRLPNRQRWSKSITKYNLLNRCFRKPPFFFSCFASIKQLRDVMIGFLYVEKQKADSKLIKHVMDEVHNKAKLATETLVAKDVCSARGNLILGDDYFLAAECLSPWTVDVDYDESLLIWHLATDLCYWKSNEAALTEAALTEREISKALSDYMSYLIVWQQTLLSSVVGMSDTRFEDTCIEALKFMNYNSKNIGWWKDPWWKFQRFLLNICCCGGQTPLSKYETQTPSEKALQSFFTEFSHKVLQVKADVRPIIAKGDKSKSVLFDACRLAKQLEMFGEMQWEITSKVWVELLCYAAVRCSPRSQIAQLSKGGELITLVWLYMAHLGLGERFLQNQGFGRTKLIIHK